MEEKYLKDIGDINEKENVINIINDEKDDSVHKHFFSSDEYLRVVEPFLGNNLLNIVYKTSKKTKSGFKSTPVSTFLGDKADELYSALTGVKSVFETEIKTWEEFQTSKINIIYCLRKAVLTLGSALGRIGTDFDKHKEDKKAINDKLFDIFLCLREAYQFFAYSDFDLTNFENDGKALTFHDSLQKERVKVSCLKYKVPEKIGEGAEGNINKIYFSNFDDGTKCVIKEDPFTVWKRSGAAGRQDKEQGLKNVADNISKQLFQQTIEEMIFGIGNTHYISKTKPVSLEREDGSKQWATSMENVQREDEGQYQGAHYLLYSTETEKKEIEGYIAKKIEGSRKHGRKIKYSEIYKPRKIDYKLIAQSLDVGVIDFISAQRDRHAGNWTLDKNGNVKLFDNDRILGLDMDTKDYEQMLNEKVPIVTTRTALQMIMLIKSYGEYKNKLNVQCGFNSLDNYKFGADSKSKALAETEKRIVMLYNRVFGTKFKLNDLDSIGDESKICEIEEHAKSLYKGLKRYLNCDFNSEVGSSKLRDTKLNTGNTGNKYGFKKSENGGKYEISDEGFRKFIRDCFEIPQAGNELDKNRFALLGNYLSQNIKNNGLINDYQLAVDCRDEKELKKCVDKFLKPRHVSIISKIFSWFGKVINSLYTTKKANLISSAKHETRIPLIKCNIKKIKPKTDKEMAKKWVKNNTKSNKLQDRNDRNEKGIEKNDASIFEGRKKTIRWDSVDEFLDKKPVPTGNKKNANMVNYVNSEKEFDLTSLSHQQLEEKMRQIGL